MLIFYNTRIISTSILELWYGNLGSAPDADINVIALYIYSHIHYRNKLVTWPDGVGERKRR